MRKVLIAFDGSEHSKRALQYVIDHAHDGAQPMEVHVVNVQHEPVLYGEWVTASMVSELSDSLLAKARSELAEAESKLSAAGITAESHALLGNVADRISETVKRLGCDTVIMGTRGLGSFSGLVLGSVANRVIHEVAVPVLLVK